MANELERKLAAGELTVGMTLRLLRTPDAALIAKACGFDAVIVDCEHGRLSADEVASLCISAVSVGVTPVVRTASAAAFHIAAALDAGAQGVLVPHIDSAADAAAAVRNAKYPPAGTRSIAAVGPPSQYRSRPLAEFTAEQNSETMVLAMIETPGGLAAAEAIAATNGIDGIMIGPNDLSAEMGIAGQVADARIRRGFEVVAKACAARDKIFIGGGVPGLDTKALLALGSRFILGSTEAGYLMAAAKADIAAIRQAADI